MERGGGRRGEQRGGEKQEGECLRSELRQMLTVKRRGDRCTAIGERKGSQRGSGVGLGRAGPSVAVPSLSSSRCSSGAFPDSPAVPNKGQSSSRQRSKTCFIYSSFRFLQMQAWNFGRRALQSER